MARLLKTRLGFPLIVACLVLAVALAEPAAAWAQDAAGADAGAPVVEKTPVFVYIIKSIGLVFGVILLSVSMWMVALVVLLTLDLRMAGVIPAGFVEEFSDTVNKRKFKEAYDMAKADPSFLGRVLTAGMSRLQY
ncbi:MAG TPA: MotA/TolQ/ExbB proton channel family protein, partial [Fimbriiglobus sp.]